MKNLLVILAFVFISSTGFSQTFSYSSGQNGSNQQVCNVTVIHGGYSYSYNISSYLYNITSIGSYHLGSLGVCSNNENFWNVKNGSGNSGPANSNFTSDQIYLVIVNTVTPQWPSSGSASITINCY